ncbi:MAG: phage portal protein [Nitratireductor sp.]
MNRFLQWLSPAGRQSNKLSHPATDIVPAIGRAQEWKHYSGPMVALHGLSDAAWSPPSAAALTREGFGRNPVVYRCVRLVSEAAASMPWLMYDDTAEITTHPVLELLHRPSPLRSGCEFLETLFGHMLVSGNAYVQLIAHDGELRELHLLRPDQVRVVTDTDGWPQAYEYGEGNRRHRFEIEEQNPTILHLALFNPLDELCGMPPLTAAHMALDIHNSASRWNKALLDNSARPSGALVYNAPEASNLTPEQFERLKSELEEGYSGPARAGRPMLLEGGLDWKAMGFSPKDMDFIEAKNGAARDIALAFGVPPMLLGIPGDLTYANYQEANRALWRQTVLPLASRVAASLGNWLSGHGGENFRLDFDRDGVEALASDREALWKRLNEATFLTDDEKRQAAGYGVGEPVEIN